MTSAYKKPAIKSRYYDDFVASIPSQEGKTFAITGTTSGTGYVAALTLAKKVAVCYYLIALVIVLTML